MGSTTYEWILDHEFGGKDPAEWKWPYDVPCWVFTHRQLPAVPDARIAFTSATVASISCVCVAVMLCTAIGWPPPMVTEPMRTVRVGLRFRFTFSGE